MKNLIIRILIRLLDTIEGTRADLDDPQVLDWLESTWQHPGARKYFASRDKKMIRALAGGAGMSELSRPDYIRQIGQRFELLHLLRDAKGAHIKREKMRKK